MLGQRGTQILLAPASAVVLHLLPTIHARPLIQNAFRVILLAAWKGVNLRDQALPMPLVGSLIWRANSSMRAMGSLARALMAGST